MKEIIPAYADGRPPAVALEQPRDLWDAILIATIFGGILGLTYLAIATPLLDPLVAIAQRGEWSGLLLRPTIIWIAMGLVLMLMRTAFWVRYKPFAPATTDEAPALTVIIPAYNEGAMVAQAIASVCRARYPEDRVEILAIDDGSTDDTWQHIVRATLAHPGRVTPIRLPANRGKRGALAEGFRRATGAVIVSIDSDSVIEPDALLAIAGPFRDPFVGAVAGKVGVHNRRHHILPRMLHVRFILAFDFLRSAQSIYRTVFCCPGALSAYRTSVVRAVLDRWENERFWGVPCTYGEDRALTNYILEAGYDSVYQRSAVVHTLVPQTYAQLCKMFLRWERSYIREEFRFARLVWRRPLLSRVCALYEASVTNLRLPVAYVAMGLWAMNAASDPTALGRMLFAIASVSTLYSLYFLRSERSWDFVYGIVYSFFAFFALSWILPYAAVTVRSRGWLTR